MSALHELKSQLPHTWPAFFAGHGNFTEVQGRAMPVILAGWDTLIVAATASGKTEAAVAPLLERHLLASRPEEGAGQRGLRLLYICPTRALVRDLYERLALPLQALKVSLAMKSGDTGPVPTRRPPEVLITTPESTDSLLTRAPRLFGALAAVVLDEIHLFDASARGDHLLCLLRRIEHIRDYRRQELKLSPRPLQRVALSATIERPKGVAARYLRDPVVVQVRGGRKLAAELYPLQDLGDLVLALPGREAAKTLVFCNTRNEVEQVAAYLRQHLSYEAAIFVHYSNLDPALRREVEARFAEASVAICVSTSTLELGIDIGSIDEVALLGPPPSLSSMLQRIGRGGRRKEETRVLCLPRSRREYLRFEALLTMAHGLVPELPPASYRFKLSVLVQQVFSLLKQSPTGGLRFADLRRIAPASLEDEALRRLLGHLSFLDYLRPGRPGEWRAGPNLNELVDEHEIYSNIGAEALGATIIDAYSGRTLARADRPRRKGEALLMGGRSLEVAWQDRYRVGVERRRGGVEERMRFHTAPAAVPLEVAQGVAARLGLEPGTMLSLPDTTAMPGVSTGVWLFHFWGDLYGALLAATLRAHFASEEGLPAVSPWNELCLRLPFSLASLPPWDGEGVGEQVRGLKSELEPQLELGRFYALLPPGLATRSVLEHCDLARLEALYRAARLTSPPAHLRAELQGLLL